MAYLTDTERHWATEQLFLERLIQQAIVDRNLEIAEWLITKRTL
jgi:hypothetical protein